MDQDEQKNEEEIIEESNVENQTTEEQTSEDKTTEEPTEEPVEEKNTEKQVEEPIEEQVEEQKDTGKLKSVGYIKFDDLTEQQLKEMNYMPLKEASGHAGVSKMTVYRFAQKMLNHKNPEMQKLIKAIKDDNPRGFKIYIYKPLTEKHFADWTNKITINQKLEEVEKEIKEPTQEKPAEEIKKGIKNIPEDKILIDKKYLGVLESSYDKFEKSYGRLLDIIDNFNKTMDRMREVKEIETSRPESEEIKTEETEKEDVIEVPEEAKVETEESTKEKEPEINL